MKTKFFISFYLAFLCLNAQHPPGVKQLAGPQTGVSFMLEDKQGTLWIGLGAYKQTTGVYSNGLKKIRNNVLSTLYPAGTFTDATELGNTVYITAYDGIYVYKDDSFQVNRDARENTCASIYKNTLWIGTMGHGLRELKNDVFVQKTVKSGGVAYDSIFSLCSNGNILWIGTNKGLLRYDGDSFIRVPTPVHPSGPFNDKRQLEIRSMQVDGYGRLWILNSNLSDTVPCLYLLNDSMFVSADDHYKTVCLVPGTIPHKINRLGRSSWGHILIGMNWGVIELSEKVEMHFVLQDIQQYYDLQTANKVFIPGTYAIENASGNIILSSAYGIMEIDRSKEDLAKFRDSFLMPYLQASDDLDINDLNVTVNNDGTIFNSNGILRDINNEAVFKVKSLGCSKVMFTGALWMGGINKNNGDLHVAAQTYRQRGSDYVPGPINSTMTYDSSLIRQYNKIWEIDRKTIDEFLMKKGQPGYIIPPSIVDWPGNAPPNCNKKMAPYKDIDQNGKYEPEKGDYPEIIGDQMLWWVFNDRLAHTETLGNSLGIQINASCYAYKDIRLSPKDSDFLVNRTVFYKFEILNAGVNDYKDFCVGIFNDPEIGNYSDDFAGFDSTLNACFAFNIDNYDEKPEGFGKNPPMVLCKFLNQKMKNVKFYNNDANPTNGNPQEAKDYYAYLRAGYYIKDSLVIKPQLGIHQYPCASTITSGVGDKRFVVSSAETDFQTGEWKTLDVAYAILHDPNTDFLKQNCDKPKQSLYKIQKWYDNNSFPSKPYWATGIEDFTTSNGFDFYPNPVKEVLNIEPVNVTSSINEIKIFDTSGKLVILKNNDGRSSAQVDVSSLNEGLYIVWILSGDHPVYSKFVKMTK